MTLFCDNTGAIALAKEPRFHRKTRHIKRRFNSIRENVQNGDIYICKVHTDLNVADPLTRPLPRAKHEQVNIIITILLLPLGHISNSLPLALESII